MMQVIDAIVKYGPIPVIIAIVIFLVYHLTRFQQNFIKTQQENIRKQQESNSLQEKHLSGFFQQMLTAITKIDHNTNPIHTPQEEADNQRVNLLINMQLQKIRADTNANRVCCYLYHNGGKDMTGRSFQKMSMSHEVVDQNTVSAMGTHQGVPRTMFPILLQKLTEQGYYYIEDMETIRDVDAITYQAFTIRGTKSVFIRAIKTTEHALLGFIAVEFNTGTWTDLEALKDCLLNKAIKISGALEVGDDVPKP